MLGLTPRCEVSRKCVDLFNTHTGDMLSLKLAEHTADEWLHLYKPKVFKGQLPDIIRQYQQLKTEKERDSFNKDNPGWVKGEEMKDYADSKRRTEEENKSNRLFLKDILQRLEGDSIRVSKVRGLLSTHQAH